MYHSWPRQSTPTLWGLRAPVSPSKTVGQWSGLRNKQAGELFQHSTRPCRNGGHRAGPFPPATWMRGTNAMCKGSRRCGRLAGRCARRGPAGTTANSRQYPVSWLTLWARPVITVCFGEGGGHGRRYPNCKGEAQRCSGLDFCHPATTPRRSGACCHCPGEVHPARGAQSHHPVAGRPGGLWAYRRPPAASGVRAPGPCRREPTGADNAASTTTMSPVRNRVRVRGGRVVPGAAAGAYVSWGALTCKRGPGRAAALGSFPHVPSSPPAGQTPLLIRPETSASVGLGAGTSGLRRRRL